MSSERWLLLTDYSSKYRISVSTLRRRIKNHQIPYRFEGGKYFIIDIPPTHPEVTALQKETPLFPELKTFAVEAAPLKEESSWQTTGPSRFTDRSHDEEPRIPFDFELGIAPAYAAYGSEQAMRAAAPAEIAAKEAFARTEHDSESDNAEPLITTATNLLNELKRAYSNILHEKEEQMIQLKEEVSDLKTLVRVLEDENERLRRRVGLDRSIQTERI